MPARARIIAPSLAVLGGVLAHAGEARAEQVLSVSPGLTFTVSIGQKLAFGLGIDLKLTGLFDAGSCSNAPRHGVGGYAQATWLNFSAWRFGAGVHGGGEVYEQSIATYGEVGWTYRTRFGDAFPGYHGIQLGAAGLFGGPVMMPSIEVPVRVIIPITGELRTPEVIPGLGARLPQMFGFPNSCVIGRPVRGEHGMMLPGAIARGERRPRALDLDRATRAALGDVWLDDARGECAAITAFLALSRDLAAVGAPASLVAGSLVAADDEVRHTLLCREVSGDLSGIDASPTLLDLPAPRDEDRRDALLRMALEAWMDGCIGEGAAAERARRGSRAASDPAARAAQAAIAEDEARHADLGWSVLRYCLASGGSEVSDALAEVSSAAGAHGDPPRGDPERDADPAALRAHGRLTRGEADAAWIDTMAAARRRAGDLLASI